MKIVFNHKFGQQEQNDIQYTPVKAVDVSKHEYDEMLDSGWLGHIIDGELEWYQSRSVRCCLDDTTYTQYPTERYKVAQTPTLVDLEHIYTSYCFHKGFDDLYQREVVNWLSNDICMEYYNLKSELVAWSKLRSYTPTSLETVIFAWDYRDPKLQIGINSLKHELSWAKAAGYKYAYIGPGYEEGCIYKSKREGFEWWTGSAWSSDIDEYVSLCKRDSSISDISALARL